MRGDKTAIFHFATLKVDNHMFMPKKAEQAIDLIHSKI